jgi:predicted secreted protein
MDGYCVELAGSPHAIGVQRDCAPSTGYRWYLTRLDQGLSLVDFGFRYDGEVRPGSGGKAFFTFQAVKEGSVGVHLTKYRTFDLSTVDAGEELTYTISGEAGAAPADTLNVLVGWTAFAPVDGDSASVLQKALHGRVGVGYTPLVVAVQVVSGRNYLFVCNARIVYPSAQNYAVLGKAYQPLKGDAEIREIVQIGHPHFVGSFGAFAPVEPDDAVFKAATKNLYGVDYTPLAATAQLVAGKNYLYAANAEVVYSGAEPYPVFVKVYQSLQGEIQITGVIDAYDYK